MPVTLSTMSALVWVSSISITALGAATRRPSQVLGMHFMNPVPLMKLVEVIRGHRTSDDTTNAILDAIDSVPAYPADDRRRYPGYGKAVGAWAKGLETAIATAKAAFPKWAAATPLRRARVMNKFRELVEANAKQLAAIITAEHGKVLEDAMGVERHVVERVRDDGLRRSAEADLIRRDHPEARLAQRGDRPAIGRLGHDMADHKTMRGTGEAAIGH